ncbi:helix-turn-helix domain-containing protein [Aquirufa sp. OSTEICH-129A]
MSDLSLFIYLILASTIGLVVSLILVFGQSISTLSSKLLAGILFCLVILSTGNSLTLTHFLYDYPQFFKTYTWSAFCLGPLLYLYIRTVLNQSYKLFWKDLWLFVPVLLYQIHRLPFDLLKKEEKYLIVKNALSNRMVFFNESEGLLPPGWIAIIRIIVLVISTFACLKLLTNWHKKIYDASLQIERNKQIYRFLWVTMILMTSGTIIVAIFTFIQVLTGMFMARLIILVISSEILLICGYLFTQPKILYGMIGWIQMEEPIRSLEETSTKNEELKPETEDTNYISYYRGKNILNSIEIHFKNNHPFTTIGYSLSDLSKEINVPAYLVSAVINQEFDKNFNEFINDARFEYLNTMRENDVNFDKYSIEYIGTAIGFGSRTSFITAIKKRTGLLPKEYLAGV